MTTAYDVPAKELIDEVAKRLQKEKTIKIPEKNMFTRTSITCENLPEDKNWWYTRCASVLRKVYIKNGIGVERLRSEYGGKKDMGSKPYKARQGSGAVLRRALQQLEEAGFIKKIRGQGRVVTPKGRSFMDNTSMDVLKKIGK